MSQWGCGNVRGLSMIFTLVKNEGVFGMIIHMVRQVNSHRLYSEGTSSPVSGGGRSSRRSKRSRGCLAAVVLLRRVQGSFDSAGRASLTPLRSG